MGTFHRCLSSFGLIRDAWDNQFLGRSPTGFRLAHDGSGRLGHGTRFIRSLLPALVCFVMYHRYTRSTFKPIGIALKSVPLLGRCFHGALWRLRLWVGPFALLRQYTFRVRACRHMLAPTLDVTVGGFVRVFDSRPAAVWALLDTSLMGNGSGHRYANRARL